MPLHVEISGSTVRDFCMLERNYLSYLKLVLLLLLLSCSALLGTRLPVPSGVDSGSNSSIGNAKLPIAVLQYIAAMLVVAAGVWEYHTGVKRLLRVRAFLQTGTKVQFALMSVVSLIVIATSIVYIAERDG
ncbi:hypothetical protein ID866_7683 [Astraeus odoratus]|nr:hypothetical protein ID866_7683 [Astraeus odoratus]